MELDEAEREGVEPFGADTGKQLFSMEGRGCLIWRNRHKHNAQVNRSNSVENLDESLAYVGYRTDGRPEDDDSTEAVRQAASVQPSTCICYQLHVTYVCLFRTPLLYVACHNIMMQRPMYSTWLKLLLILECTVYVQGQLAFIKLISALGHILHSVWFRILSLRHHHTVQVAKCAHVHVCT